MREQGEDDATYLARVNAAKAEHDAAQEAAAAAYDEQAMAAMAPFDLSQTDVRGIGEPGHLGMGEATLQAAEDVGGAEIAQSEAVAGALRETAELQQRTAEEMRAADMERRDFARQQRDAITEARRVQDETRKKIESLPDLDPGRYWDTQSGASKFFAIIGAMAGGALGSMAVPQMLQDAVSRDLEVQKAERNLAFDAGAAADASVQQQSNLYSQLLASAGDEAAADAMYAQQQLGVAASKLEALIAETTVPIQRAQLQEALVGVRQRMDAMQDQIDLVYSTTPERITKRVDPIGRRRRRQLEERAEKLDTRTFELAKMGIEQEQKIALEDAKAAVKAGELSESDYSGLRSFAKDTAKLQTANAIFGKFLEDAKDGDIAGRGFDVYFATEEGRTVRETLREGLRRQLRYESQGVIGEDEIEDRVDSVMSGWGDDELLSNIQRLYDANAQEVSALEYALPEKARKVYYRNPDLAPLGSRRPMVPSEGADDDAAALGGRRIR